MSALHTLLHRSIDYAGLFPPAGLEMRAAVANYQDYRGSPDAWALGRFIVPADRLHELEEASGHYPHGATWQLSVLVGPDLGGDIAQIADFQRRHAGTSPRMAVAAVELKADSGSAIQDTMLRLPQGLPVYFELPIRNDLPELVATVARTGGRAKVRTGGVTPQAFPSTASLAQFIRACTRAGVAFKATAGLHHALRAEYRLTYDEDSGTGMMFGFLNLFLATALARSGAEEADIHGVLEESSPQAFRLEDTAINWRNHRLDHAALQRSRESIVSFGSCSFTEPMAELRTLHWVEPEMHQA